MKLFKKNNRAHLKGNKEEQMAIKFLKKKGLKLIQANYHSRFGEIDIIMWEKKELVFIEVKARKENAQVSAIESITTSKINKITKTAQIYLQTLETIPSCRFDVVAVTNYKDNKSDINWVKNAW